MERNIKIDEILQIVPPAHGDFDRARAGLAKLDDDKLTPLHANLVEASRQSQKLVQDGELDGLEEMTPETRDLIIRELAKAHANDPFAVNLIAYAFEHAVAMFDICSDEELVKQYRDLKQNEPAPVPALPDLRIP